MGWTNPETFTSGQILTAVSMNKITDNTAFLKALVNVVTATKVDHQTVTSTTLVDISGLSASITPTFNTSKIKVDVTVTAGAGATSVGFLQLLRGTTEIAKGTAGSGQNRTFLVYPGSTTPGDTYSISFIDSPATTSATTYKMQGYVLPSGTMYINRPGVDAVTGLISSITVSEIPVP